MRGEPEPLRSPQANGSQNAPGPRPAAAPAGLDYSRLGEKRRLSSEEPYGREVGRQQQKEVKATAAAEGEEADTSEGTCGARSPATLPTSYWWALEGASRRAAGTPVARPSRGSRASVPPPRLAPPARSVSRRPGPPAGKQPREQRPRRPPARLPLPRSRVAPALGASGLPGPPPTPASPSPSTAELSLGARPAACFRGGRTGRLVLAAAATAPPGSRGGRREEVEVAAG
ncbi:hypothetical protein P7K49_007290 [Saguinus oedipus]|uniref:Uncharacterized protein n=1 Tax=Saguinus oedipus TaxID=9490 RepID=A0ABQ9VUG3_SAGOE|nr:hypothetical protein P7K49_007290 [Saguinus oedipus]